LFEHWQLLSRDPLDPHDTEDYEAIWNIERENVACDQIGELGIRRGQVHPMWLGRIQSCSRLRQNCPSLVDEMWTVSLPALEVPTMIDSGDRLITDYGIKATKFGLSHSEADERAHTIFSVKPPLVPLKNPS
jgi:hypothetical protein